MTDDPSQELRGELRGLLAKVGAEEQSLDRVHKRVHQSALEHHDVAGGIAKDAHERAQFGDSEGEDALLYEQALRDRRRAALVGGHLGRKATGEE